MRFVLTLSVLLLAACDNLGASLLDDSNTHTYTPSYTAEGQQHSMSVSFVVQEGEVIGLDIEPGAVSGAERGKQLAFSANVRRYVLDRTPSEISLVLPTSVGSEQQLTDIFRSAVQDLIADL